MPRSYELFTPAMYEQNLAAIAAISELLAFTDDDYAKLATLDDECWRIQNISDYDYTQSTQTTHEVFYEKIFQERRDICLLVRWHVVSQQLCPGS